MLRSRKGQSALEYAALITVLAAIVAALIFGAQSGTIRTNVEGTYNSTVEKIGTAQGWITQSMQTGN